VLKRRFALCIFNIHSCIDLRLVYIDLRLVNSICTIFSLAFFIFCLYIVYMNSPGSHSKTVVLEARMPTLVVATLIRFFSNECPVALASRSRFLSTVAVHFTKLLVQNGLVEPVDSEEEAADIISECGFNGSTARKARYIDKVEIITSKDGTFQANVGDVEKVMEELGFIPKDERKSENES